MPQAPPQHPMLRVGPIQTTSQSSHNPFSKMNPRIPTQKHDGPSSNKSPPLPLPKPPPPIPSQSMHHAAPPIPAKRATASQSTTSDSSIGADNDEDAFVVRVPPNRERNPIAIPTLDDAEAWPEVGKSSAIKSNKEKDVEHSQQLGTGSKKSSTKDNKFEGASSDERSKTMALLPPD
ncbi:hypothetical protein JOM56_014729 [Amanita muscaria]